MASKYMTKAAWKSFTEILSEDLRKEYRNIAFINSEYGYIKREQFNHDIMILCNVLRQCNSTFDIVSFLQYVRSES